MLLTALERLAIVIRWAAVIWLAAVVVMGLDSGLSSEALALIGLGGVLPAAVAFAIAWIIDPEG